MHWIDWSIIGGLLVALIAIAFYVKQFNRSVADFLVANRSAGRYLLTISQAATFLSGVMILAAMQRDYKSGFAGVWWGLTLIQPLSLLVSLGGFIIYRYRESRVMTVPQLFEIRYSKRFRIFCGCMAWVSGILNMGLFPAVMGKFFMYYFDLPDTFAFLGIAEIPTYPMLMVAELSLAILVIFLGGMIVVVVTDFFQCIFCLVSLLAILFTLASIFNWDQVFTSLASAPENASLLNPFETSATKAFGYSYYLIFSFLLIYGGFVFLGGQGYAGAAKNAHEGKMAAVLGKWRYMIQTGMLVCLPICVFVYMNHADFAIEAQEIRETLSSIPNEKIADQVRAPMAMSRFLPVGILGLLGAFLIAATISTDDTFLHSWGTVLVQDVILPFRKKSFTPRQHMWLLRGAMLLVAVLVFLISLFMPQTDYLPMFFAMTHGLFAAGAGIGLIGGLYWKRGTTKAAWSGMIIGGMLAGSGMITRILWKETLGPWILTNFHNLGWLDNNGEFFLNGQKISLIAALTAITTYVLVSLYDWLILKKPAFNLERMLHRGKYAIKSEHADKITLPATGFKAFLPGKEYPMWDKILHMGLMVWTFCLFGIGIGAAVVHFFFGGIPDSWWIWLWKNMVYVFGTMGLVTTVWFLVGGLRDIKRLFATLRTKERNDLDDGRVIDHQSLIDTALKAEDLETTTESED